MKRRIAIVGAGVSGLTCGVLFAERGYRTAIFAKETGQQTTSGAAAALWFPYDAEPAEKVIPWALQTYKVLVDLIKNSRSGVSIIELRQFSRTSEIQIPEWAIPLGASVIPTVPAFKGGFTLKVPLMDTTIYLDHLAKRFFVLAGRDQRKRADGRRRRVLPPKRRADPGERDPTPAPRTARQRGAVASRTR